MSFLDNILPSSIFGHQMPWAHHESLKPQETAPENKPQDTKKEEPSAPEQESISPEIPNEPIPPIDPSKSIEDGLSKLKVEQFFNIEKRAAELHGKSKALHSKIQGIDELLSLIQEWSTQHPNESIDCQDPEIKRATETLRQQGIRVPLPEKTLEAGQIGSVFTIMGNQRSSLSDTLKEHSSEFQQCTVERNNLLQHLMSMISGLSRVKNKISSNFSSRTH